MSPNGTIRRMKILIKTTASRGTGWYFQASNKFFSINIILLKKSGKNKLISQGLFYSLLNQCFNFMGGGVDKTALGDKI